MYQGDENDFVIVSMVRSSDPPKGIGFVGESNRRCVAQSRARRGLYFVGNANMFLNHPTWRPLMEIMAEKGKVGSQLKLKCKNHQHVAFAVSKITLESFCKEPCMLAMSCQQHNCDKKCQPPHSHNPCHVLVPFTHTLCGHQDTRKCHQDADRIRCTSIVQFAHPKCGHPGQRKCYEDQTTLSCGFELTGIKFI